MLAVATDSVGVAFSRAGEAMLRRFANSTATVLEYEFAVHRRDLPSVPALDGSSVQSSLLEIDAMAADVEAAPTCLFEGDRISLDGCACIIVSRTERVSLGQVTLQLEVVP